MTPEEKAIFWKQEFESLKQDYDKLQGIDTTLKKRTEELELLKNQHKEANGKLFIAQS